MNLKDNIKALDKVKDELNFMLIRLSYLQFMGSIPCCCKIFIASAEMLISKETPGGRERRGVNRFKNQVFDLSIASPFF